MRLVELGRRIEAHFGRPQDIEWCLADDDFHIVQSRPITTLFPIPQADGDGENHVYLSVGHQQMMTDAMKPLGLSVWLLTAMAPMHEAGGRLFVDITRHLASPAGRAGLMGMVGKSDPLTGDALQTIIDRDFIPLLPDEAPGGPPAGGAPAPIETDPAIVAELIERSEASIAALKRDIADPVGTGAARVPAGGHPGAQAVPERSAQHAGDHGGGGGHVVAQRAAGGVARRDRTRSARSRSPSPATSRRRWGSRSWTSRT